jgi:hypothetical protein
LDKVYKSVSLDINKTTSQIDIHYTEDLNRGYEDVAGNLKKPHKTNKI